MGVLFQHAMRYEWMKKNPIRLVRQSALPQQEQIVLEHFEVAALLEELHEPFATLIFLAAVTGLRRGELFGLKWEDINFAEGEMRVVRLLVDQIEGPPKTLASRRPLPLSKELATALKNGGKKPHITNQVTGYSPAHWHSARDPIGLMRFSNGTSDLRRNEPESPNRSDGITSDELSQRCFILLEHR